MNRSIEHVEFTILEDAVKHGKRFEKSLKYPLLAVIEKVTRRWESVVSLNTVVPSYVWCRAYLDEGSVQLEVDSGKLPNMIPYANCRRNSYRVNAIREEVDMGGPWSIIGVEESFRDPWSGPVKWMLENGIELDQRFLLRTKLWVDSGGYDGESDWGVESKVIFAEDPGEMFWVPTPRDVRWTGK